MIETLEWTLLDGEHALLVKGDMRRARERFDYAYAEAAQRGEAAALARAALGLGGMWVHEHRTAAAAATVRVRQREALSRLDADSPLALRLRIRLAAEDDYRTGGHEAIMALAAEARTADDPVALAEALSLAHHCMLGPGDGARRMELARELIGVASRTGRRSDLLIGLLWRTVDLLLEADPHAERALGELRTALDGAGQQAIEFVVGAIEVMLSTRAGRFEQAEERAAACYERGMAAGDHDAPGWYVRQLAAIRWYQGRIGELVPLLSDLVNSPMLAAVDDSPYAGLAVAAATAGDRRLAEGMLARLRGGVLADRPRTSTWLLSMYAIVEAADLLGDAELAARAAALLAPYAGLPVMTSPGIVCLGSVRHSLGVAAIVMGDPDAAVAHLRRAVHENLALGHWPAVALSRSRLGQALALRDGPRDEGARGQLALAAQEAEALGMRVPSRVAERVTCRPEGPQWRVELGARTALVDHCVGMLHLAALLANPGKEIPAADLAAGSPDPAAPARMSAQRMLDGPAGRAYRNRLAQLDAEIAELEAGQRREEARERRAERDWLVAELASAAGLGGRPRTFAGSEERARTAVGKAIRRAVDRVAIADPVIGEELRATVRTGLRCSYDPG
ncbi:regulatory protein, LuxR [[Actinomadura] parvosata subsp. kistnae]|uniref:MalT-like TPR region domain-containing protein n=1 Tax=[Actinomadura] parvosata subsp. kistnae TaxID=1909395 RepID=A0A1U9ZS76_9ACTN|nr:hypothetical protein [Nonomuraea sp. ATCC 55076]AQZ60816.1 hypothetical protein BKM31_04250 [Nonomuraea sp. ATCC 55076]SPL90542.1 regulatory protein, LuxR [Actinomadura parvosata subsp. kistnae]